MIKNICNICWKHSGSVHFKTETWNVYHCFIINTFVLREKHVTNMLLICFVFFSGAFFVQDKHKLSTFN